MCAPLSRLSSPHVHNGHEPLKGGLFIVCEFHKSKQLKSPYMHLKAAHKKAF